MAKRANGEGNVHRRGDGRWQVSFPTGLRNDKGKAEVIYKYATTQAEAAELLRCLQADKAMGVKSKEAKRLTAGQWMEHWIEKDRGPKLAPSTLTGYRSHFRLHINPYIGNISLQDLDTYHIQRMLDNAGGSLSLFIKVYNIIHCALEKAVKQKLILHNPCIGVAFPKDDKKEMRVFTLQEQRKFVEALEGEYYRPLFLTYLNTGMRLGEGLPLLWSDIDLENRSIRVSKKAIVRHDYNSHSAVQEVQNFCKTKSSTRTITITPMLVNVLREHKQFQMEQTEAMGGEWSESNLVFPNTRDNIPHNRNVQAIFERILKKAKVERATMHCLRHTYATRCFEVGVEIKAVSAQLGHRDVKTTYNTYIHLLEDKRVKEIDKLNELDKLMA